MTLAIPAAHALQLARLRTQHPTLQIVLIGAAAVGHHVPLGRHTRDVDLVVVVEPADIPALLEPLDWRQDRTFPIRWHGPDDFRADLLPVSDELLCAGVLMLDGGSRALNLTGIDLALRHAIEVPLSASDQTIRSQTSPRWSC